VKQASGLSPIDSFAASLELGNHLDLLRQALTHRSRGERSPQGDNERLELLGDAVVALVILEHLYRTQPDLTEGELTKLKAHYVNRTSLAVAAKALGLGEMLTMASGELAAGGRDRPSTLADSFEAVLAAIYLARGLEAAREFVHRELMTRVDTTEVWDHKSRLQEWCQANRKQTPTYRTADIAGPAHQREFRCEALLGDEVLADGIGRSKKEAEQRAAETALALLTAAPKRKKAPRAKAPPVPAPGTPSDLSDSSDLSDERAADAPKRAIRRKTTAPPAPSTVPQAPPKRRRTPRTPAPEFLPSTPEPSPAVKQLTRRKTPAKE
jgi:ribonuclease-3